MSYDSGLNIHLMPLLQGLIEFFFLLSEANENKCITYSNR